MVGAEQRLYTRRRQTRRVDQAGKSQKRPKETIKTPIKSLAESSVCWRGKSPPWTEAIPTSPDRVQQQSSHAKTQVSSYKMTRNDKFPTSGPMRWSLKEGSCFSSSTLADHNPSTQRIRTPTHMRRNTTIHNIEYKSCNYTPVREDVIHCIKDKDTRMKP